MENSEPRKLYRSRKNRVFAGVCGGLGEFFDIDPTWVRLLFVFFLLAAGSTLLVYLIMWLVVPEAPNATS